MSLFWGFLSSSELFPVGQESASPVVTGQRAALCGTHLSLPSVPWTSHFSYLYNFPRPGWTSENHSRPSEQTRRWQSFSLSFQQNIKPLKITYTAFPWHGVKGCTGYPGKPENLGKSIWFLPSLLATRIFKVHFNKSVVFILILSLLYKKQAFKTERSVYKSRR